MNARNASRVFRLLYDVLVVVLLLWLLWLSWPPQTERVTEVVYGKADTVVVVERDTITKYMPTYIERHSIDTLYITDTIFIREQRHYHEADEYDIWISGYEPKLDSVKIFPKIEYRTITNTITNTIEKQEYTFYAGGGIDAFGGFLAPKASISLATPKKWLITANLGYYDGVYYGLTIQKKLSYD